MSNTKIESATAFFRHTDTCSRSLTTVFNVLLTYFILGQKTSLPAIACCAVIVGGFYLGVDQEDASGTFTHISPVLPIPLNDLVPAQKPLPQSKRSQLF